MNRLGRIKLILLFFLTVLLVVVVIWSVKEPPYTAHISCKGSNCYAFIETGRKNLWFEFCRKTNLAVNELKGLLKERKGESDGL